jgi:uncharacterized protein (DUF2267 family)
MSADRAETAMRGLLGGLGRRLAPAQRDLVAEELPPALAALLVESGELAIPLEEMLLVDRDLGDTRELIASACRALAEELSVEAVEALRAAAPPSIAALFVTADPAVPAGGSRNRQNLASGRPGSQRPLSERRR